jgi:hypothetical protein
MYHWEQILNDPAPTILGVVVRLSWSLLAAVKAPFIDCFATKSIIVADTEGRQLALFQEFVHGRRVHAQKFGYFPNGQNSRELVCHNFPSIALSAVMRNPLGS